jgi:hypothetical protein
MIGSAEEATEQRGDVAYFKGSAIGRARLDGSQEEEVEYTFNFQDRYIGSPEAPIRLKGRVGSTIQTALQGQELLREMVRDSVSVAVEFEGRESVGYLKRASGVPRRKGVREVTLTYQPTRADRFQLGELVPLKADPPDILGRIRDNWLGFLTNARVPIQTARGKLDQIQEVANAVNEAITEAAAVINEAHDTVEGAHGLSRGFTGLLANIRNEASNFDDRISEPSANMVQTDDPVQQIFAMTLLADSERATRDARHVAAVEARRLALLEGEDVLGVHVAMEDEDLRLVCLGVYGTADVWIQVAQYNGLVGSTLSAGQRVVLPQIDLQEVV